MASLSVFKLDDFYIDCFLILFFFITVLTAIVLSNEALPYLSNVKCHAW